MATLIFSQTNDAFAHATISNGEKKYRSNQSNFFILLEAIFIVALIGGTTRERMMHVGPFYEMPANVKISDGYFSGLRTGNQFFFVLENILRAKEKFSSNSIYFGPA